MLFKKALCFVLVCAHLPAFASENLEQKLTKLEEELKTMKREKSFLIFHNWQEGLSTLAAASSFALAGREAKKQWYGDFYKDAASLSAVQKFALTNSGEMSILRKHIPNIDSLISDPEKLSAALKETDISLDEKFSKAVGKMKNALGEMIESIVRKTVQKHGRETWDMKYFKEYMVEKRKIQEFYAGEIALTENESKLFRETAGRLLGFDHTLSQSEELSSQITKEIEQGLLSTSKLRLKTFVGVGVGMLLLTGGVYAYYHAHPDYIELTDDDRDELLKEIEEVKNELASLRSEK